MIWSGLGENPAMREIAADCLCGRALTGTRKAINKQDIQARDGRLHRGARDHTVPQHPPARGQSSIESLLSLDYVGTASRCIRTRARGATIAQPDGRLPART